MFILQLKNKLKAYDPYGEHRTNGLKAVFVVELLFLFNYVYSIPNPYFYYFYVPLTAFAAEVAGNTLTEKYCWYFFTVMGSAIAIFCFGIFSSYKIFFVFFVFFYALWLYLTAVYKLKNMLVPAPLILSLAAYSLIYVNGDNNIYLALNHALQTIVAMLVVLAGLVFFPKRYYFAIWQRAFHGVLVQLAAIALKIYQDELERMPIISGIIVMERFSKMLSRQMKFFSILKITLLTFELALAMAYHLLLANPADKKVLLIVHKYLTLLAQNCPKLQSLPPLAMIPEVYQLKILQQLISSWNYLCQQQS